MAKKPEEMNLNELKVQFYDDQKMHDILIKELEGSIIAQKLRQIENNMSILKNLIEEKEKI